MILCPGDFNVETVLSFVWLQVSVAQLEQQLADCEAELTEEKVVSQERKRQAEENQFQVNICFFVSFLYLSYLLTDLKVWTRPCG